MKKMSEQKQSARPQVRNPQGRHIAIDRHHIDYSRSREDTIETLDEELYEDLYEQDFEPPWEENEDELYYLFGHSPPHDKPVNHKRQHPRPAERRKQA